MSLTKAIISGGISLCCITAASTQDFSNYRPETKVLGFQEYEQRKWRMQHLPKNSYFLLPSLEYMSGLDVPPDSTLPRIYFFCGYTGRSDESLVTANWQARKLEYCHWQKEGWWRNRSQGTVSLLLRNILQNIDRTH